MVEHCSPPSVCVVFLLFSLPRNSISGFFLILLRTFNLAHPHRLFLDGHAIAQSILGRGARASEIIIVSQEEEPPTDTPQKVLSLMMRKYKYKPPTTINDLFLLQCFDSYRKVGNCRSLVVFWFLGGWLTDWQTDCRTVRYTVSTVLCSVDNLLLFTSREYRENGATAIEAASTDHVTL